MHSRPAGREITDASMQESATNAIKKTRNYTERYQEKHENK
jgi:hypothetical protein